MSRLPAASACLLLTGCGLLPTPRTDALWAAARTPARPLTAGEKAERRADREERREREQERCREEKRRAGDYARLVHAQENARRRRNGQENVPYKDAKEDRDSVGGAIVGGIAKVAFEAVADEAADRAAEGPTVNYLGAALFTPLALTADVAVGSAKAAHKAVLGMSSNEYRGRHDNWDSAGAFD